MSENTRQFGSGRHLIGTFTGPDVTVGPPSGLMVLLTNAGLISRCGPNRMNVRLARHFAAMGMPSLRFDMSGLGDSGRPSAPLPLHEQAVEDTRAAMDEAQRMYGVSRFVMIGFCSGAEAAYTTALQDERLAGVVLFDLFTYPTWRTHLLRLKHRIRRYGLLSAMGRLALAMLRLMFSRTSRLLPSPETESPSTAPTRKEFAARLNELHGRGTRVLILHSVESEMHNYEEQFRDNFKEFGLVGKVDHRYLRKCDHVFSTAEGQNAMVSTAVDWIRTLQDTETASHTRLPPDRRSPGEGRG